MSYDNPELTIILNSYNQTSWLREAIESVLSQTVPNSLYELIIADDCSTNLSTIKIIDEYTKVHTNVRSIMLQTNHGTITRGRNMGIDIAKGKYIAFLDDDNRRKPNYNEKILEYFKFHPNTHILVCNSESIDHEGKGYSNGPLIPKPIPISLDALRKCNYIDSGEIIVRKEVFEWLGGFDEEMSSGEDWDFMLRAAHCINVDIIPDVLCQYRLHSKRRSILLPNNPNTIDEDRAKVSRRINDYGEKYRIYLIHPDINKITQSQQDMLNRLLSVFKDLSYGIQHMHNNIPDPREIYSLRPNLILIFIPFQIDLKELIVVQKIVKKMEMDGYSITSAMLNIEDPYAFDGANKKAAQFVEWVATNEINCMDRYKNLWADRLDRERIILFPTLSPCNSDNINSYKRRTDIDVVMVAYGYPDRIELIQKLGKTKYRILIAGDGWGNSNISNPNCSIIHRTVSNIEMMGLYKNAKLILAKRRTSPDKPNTPSRGFIETFSGTATLLDNTGDIGRYFSPDKEIVLYDSPEELNRKILYYLANHEEREQIGHQGRIKSQKYMLEKRLLRMINNIRCNRKGVGVDVLDNGEKYIYAV